jgi:hypothetical protein
MTVSRKPGKWQQQKLHSEAIGEHWAKQTVCTSQVLKQLRKWMKLLRIYPPIVSYNPGFGRNEKRFWGKYQPLEQLLYQLPFSDTRFV